MAEIPTEVEQLLADLPADEWDALCARVKPPENHPDPKIRAAAALRAMRAGKPIDRPADDGPGLDSTGRGRIQPGTADGQAPSDKAAAVAALRELRGGPRMNVTYE